MISINLEFIYYILLANTFAENMFHEIKYLIMTQGRADIESPR